MSKYPPITFSNIVTQQYGILQQRPLRTMLGNLSAAIAQYVKQKTTAIGSNKRNVAWGGKTRLDNEAALNLFLEVTGDVDIADLQPNHRDTYFDVLARLPPNRRKDRRYRTLSLQQILDSNPPQTIEARTFSKYRAALSGFINWLEGRYGNKLNISTRGAMIYKVDASDESGREGFSAEQLKLLFESPKARPMLRNSVHKWVPLIALVHWVPSK